MLLAIAVVIEFLVGAYFTVRYFTVTKDYIEAVHDWQRERRRAADEKLLLMVQCAELSGRVHNLIRRCGVIRQAITRRPPRRRWLAMAFRVAKLADIPPSWAAEHFTIEATPAPRATLPRVTLLEVEREGSKVAANA